MTSASSIRSSSSAIVGTAARGTIQSSVLSRCVPSISEQFTVAAGGKIRPLE